MKDKILQKLNLSAGTKNVAKIISGTMAGQLISFFTLPIMTRMYGAGIMGVWAVVSSFTYIIKAFSDLGLGNAIMVEDEEHTLDTYNVISTLSLFTSFLMGVFFYVYYVLFPNGDNIPAFTMASIIAVNAWLAKQVDTCYSWLNKEKNYKVLMRNPVINNVAIAVISILLGVLGYKKYGYYIGYMSGTLFTLLNMKKHLPLKIFTINVKRFVRTFKVHRNFIKYQMPANLFTQVKNALPSLLMKNIFGSWAIGYLSVSMRIVNTPINLLGTSVGRVFFSDVAGFKRKGQVEKISDYVISSMKKSFRLAIIPFTFIFAFGDVIAVVFLGEKWYPAGQMLRVMSFMALFTLVMMSTQGLSIVLEKQKYNVYIAVFQIISGLFSFIVIGKIFDSAILSLTLFAVFTVITQTIYFSFLYRAMGVSPKVYLKNAALDLVLMFVGTVILRFIAMQFSIVDTILF